MLSLDLSGVKAESLHGIIFLQILTDEIIGNSASIPLWYGEGLGWFLVKTFNFLNDNLELRWLQNFKICPTLFFGKIEH
jgi:hypothetical protein